MLRWTTDQRIFLPDKFSNLRDQLSEFGGFQAGIERSSAIRGGQSYRNAFDIPRRTLIDQVVRMRANFLQPTLAHTKIMDEGLYFDLQFIIFCWY